MNHLKEHYRNFQKPEYVFFNTPEKQTGPDISEAEKQVKEKMGKEFIVGQYATAEPQKIYEAFKEHFSPEKYRKEITEFVETAMKDKMDAETRRNMVGSSVMNYKKEYDKYIGELLRSVGNRNFNETYKAMLRARREITGAVHSQLDELRGRVEAGRDAAGSAGAIKAGPDAPPYARRTPEAMEGIPIIGPLFKYDIPILTTGLRSPEYNKYREVWKYYRDQFEDYTKRLGEFYVVVKPNKGVEKVPIIGPAVKMLSSDDVKDYRKAMVELAGNQVNYLFETGYEKPGNIKAELEKLTDQLKKSFESTAAKTGDRTRIEDDDIRALRQEAFKLNPARLAHAIKTGQLDYIEHELDSYRMVDKNNQECFEKAVLEYADYMLADAGKNGTEQKIIDFMKPVLQARGKKPAESFAEASKEFKELLKNDVKGGAKPVVERIRDFNNAVSAGMMNLLDNVSPAQLRPLVETERQWLLSGRTTPENDRDLMVVEFMRATRAERERMLAEPRTREKLFIAIESVKTHYSAYYNKEFKNLRNSREKEMLGKKDVANPNRFNLAARCQALIILAQEAEWVSTQLYKKTGDELQAASDKIGSRKNPYQPRLDFKGGEKPPARYVSAVAAGGFNARDLGLDLVQAIAGIMVVANAFRAWKENDPLNPYLIGGIAAIYGVGKYKENPRMARMLTAGPGEQAEISAQGQLNEISKQMSSQSIKNFIQSDSEWKIMEGLDQRTVKKLLDAAKKRPGKPKITKADLRSVEVPEFDALTVPEGNENARYHFYEKFMLTVSKLSGGDRAVALEQLREHARTWKI